MIESALDELGCPYIDGFSGTVDRRLARYRDHYRLVTHPSEPLGERNFIIMTQEGFLEIDEFYKLGAGAKKDSRRTLLNVAWSRLRRTGAQFYLLGPNVDDLDEKLPPELRGRLIRSDFKSVAVDIDDRSSVTDQESDLLHLVKRDLSGSSVTFGAARGGCSSTSLGKW